MSAIFSFNCHLFSLIKECISCFARPPESTKDTHNVTAECFKKNYMYQLVKSSVVGTAAYLSGGISLGAMAIQGVNSTAVVTATTSLFLNIVWHKYANTPGLLADSAFAALSKNEEKALEMIQKGADIHHDFSCSYSGLPFLSCKLIVRGARKKSDSLIEEAVKNNRVRVISCLSRLGVGLNQSSSILGHANKLETVKTLVSHGSNVNLHNNRQFSPLYIQICGQSNGDYSDERLEIINFLLEKGSKFQQGARFNEKSRCVAKIQSLINSDAAPRSLTKLRKILEALKSL